MSFPRYPRYKDSGVEWLGQVPEHWALKPLWTFFRRVKRTGFEDEQLLSVYRDHGVIPKSSRDDNFNKPSDDLSVYQLVVPGDLAINKMKAWQGSVAISTHRGIVSPAYFVYEALHTANSRYLHYLMRSVRYITGYLSVSKGIRINQWDLEPQLHSRMPLTVPSPEEQIDIVGFLDQETGKIDELVAEQQRLVELLKEKRQAIISHAVTRGLNPVTLLKSSGIECLGDVPEHWQTSRLKYATSKIVDCPHETPTLSDDGYYLTIRTSDIDQGAIFPDQMRTVDENEYLHRIRREPLLRHDIVYSREGGRWGHAALVPEENRFCLGQRMMQFRANNQFVPSYLMWHLNAKNVYVQGDVDTVGAASPHVNVGTICNYRIAAPPFEEQSRIAAYLDLELKKFDTLTAEAQRAIELLQERRIALISAAVTGQIDVRYHARKEFVR